MFRPHPRDSEVLIALQRDLNLSFILYRKVAINQDPRIFRCKRCEAHPVQVHTLKVVVLCLQNPGQLSFSVKKLKRDAIKERPSVMGHNVPNC